MLRQHVRRTSGIPAGQFYRIECSCGWIGKVAIHKKGRRLTKDQLLEAAEKAFVEHIPPRHRRVYLLCDLRPPVGFQSLDEIRAQLKDAAELEGEKVSPAILDLQARARFDAQIVIRGNFLMPEGTRVHLTGSDERDGLKYGRFTVKGGHEQELPIGEVRLADGRVIAVDE